MKIVSFLNSIPLVLAATVLLQACSNSGEGPKPVSNLPPVETKVTRQNYLSGEKFCEVYAKERAGERAKWVEVPRDYSNPKAGTLRIYTYTVSPLVPGMPVYLYFDGGPGQNTHGHWTKLDLGVNGIYFDQRGLGCSAPATYDQYIDSSLYSTENTIRDADLIRQAYGLQKVSVYGVSYGTVPATMYGAKFPQNTQSVVLEGVVGNAEGLHDVHYKVEKLNLVLAGLSWGKRKSFSEVVRSDQDSLVVLYGLAMALFYQDKGMQTFKFVLEKSLSDSGSGAYKDVIAKLKSFLASTKEKYPYPQQPGSVDSNILTIIYCKNLKARSQPQVELNYSTASDSFIVSRSEKNSMSESCDEVGVSRHDERPFELSQNKIQVPVYYFQGSHDGATQAKGAILHWKTVPQAASFFLLAQKGGHNPAMTRAASEDLSIRLAQRNLFTKAFSADLISNSDLLRINSNLKENEKWLLYSSPRNQANTGMGRELEGISNSVQVQF